ncbi:hypothetical protein RvY_16895 [Ramazzottius varieornatus]|uniref:Major facilitator superfamily (MFS) profile domain-containing protein n=1 Tax=Ramazzottius varieornatus TaxID=947166 RepID=A0A1D1W054_RAMVA|nr:hypothetical protein RvY_16895 [Ramazzottius varieornatus]
MRPVSLSSCSSEDQCALPIKPVRFGHRHVLLVLAFCGICFMYATRVGLSIAMVAMTAQPVGWQHSDNLSVACPANVPMQQLNVTKRHRTYNWDPKMQGLLHGAFFYGYLLSQIPGAWLSHRIGAKVPFGVSMVAIGVLTIFAPVAADAGVGTFFVFRLAVGFFQGIIFPSITSLWTKWAPPLERGRLLSVTYSGAHLGTVFGMFVAGFLADTHGWESIFFVFGGLCLLWALPWFFIAHDSPAQHPRISARELAYITHSLRSDTCPKPEFISGLAPSSLHRPIPLTAILKTPAFLAVLVVEFGHHWAFYTMTTNLPTYFDHILHLSIRRNGALSAMPYLVRFIVTILAVFLGDYWRTQRTFSPSTLRKIFSNTAFVGSGAALIAVAFVGCNSTQVVALFGAAVGFSGMIYAGYIIGYSEMSPTFGGILIAVGNSSGTVTGIVAPYVVGVLTQGPEGQTVERWQIVFLISAGMYAFITLVYTIFGSAKRQKWDE